MLMNYSKKVGTYWIIAGVILGVTGFGLGYLWSMVYASIFAPMLVMIGICFWFFGSRVWHDMWHPDEEYVP